MATSASKTAPKVVPKIVAPAADLKDEAPVVKTPKKKRIVIALAVLFLLGAGGGGAWYFIGSDEGATPVNAESKPMAPKPPLFVILDQFTVNLQAETSDQFLQVSMTLQVTDQSQEDIIKQYMPQVRNRLLLLLSSKKASEILSIDGKKKLSEEIIAQVKLPFTPKAPPQGVTGVFFTSFVIQ